MPICKGDLVRLRNTAGEYTPGIVDVVDEDDVSIRTERGIVVVAASKLRLDLSDTQTATWDLFPDNRTTLTDGTQVYPGHREDRGDGQQKGYVVLSEEERAKGFVRPVRRSYRHLRCGGTTTMGLALAETYARDPAFYSGTFCCICGSHFPVGEDGEFVWKGTDEKVGT